MKGLNPMTQANRVHSTPRRTASKIKAQPAAAQQDLVSSLTIINQPTTEDRIRIDASRAHAYCGLESQVTECFLQAEVGDCYGAFCGRACGRLCSTELHHHWGHDLPM